MLNKKGVKDLLLYMIVGGIATVAEWVAFYLVNDICHWHYMLATVVAYVFSTFVNWLAGRIIMFKNTNKSILFEIISIYMASIIGLLLNLLIMWFAVDICNVQEMLSKIIATGCVFIWNYLIRKLFIYKNNTDV